jgi:hypothetical protein
MSIWLVLIHLVSDALVFLAAAIGLATAMLNRQPARRTRWQQRPAAPRTVARQPDAQPSATERSGRKHRGISRRLVDLDVS